jgi:hypothetical protein
MFLEGAKVIIFSAGKRNAFGDKVGICPANKWCYLHPTKLNLIKNGWRETVSRFLFIGECAGYLAFI